MKSKKHDGYILVLVLFMILLLASMVLLFGYESRVEIELTGNLRDETRAYYIAKSGLHLAHWVISNDEPDIDHFSEQWASEIIPLPLTEGSITGGIFDESAKLSLASLFPGNQEMADEEYFQIFSRLFDILGYDINLLDAVLDWLDTDDIPRGFYGAESNYYRSRDNPYNARNGTMESNYELFMIRGITPVMIMGSSEKEKQLGFPDGLIHYLTVYPTDKINLNTAPKPVLMALNERMSQFEAELILDSRDTEPFKDLGDIRNTGISQQYFESLSRFGTFNTDYFSVTMVGNVNRSKKALHAVYQRQKKSATMIYYREDP